MVGFFDRLNNLGKGWIQTKKSGRDLPPEVEQEIADGGMQEHADVTVAKAPTKAAPPSPGDPKPDEPPTRVKKTL